MSEWDILTEFVLVKVFSLLEARDVERMGMVCRRWCWIARDQLLWKELIHRDFCLEASYSLSPGTFSWREEYRRLAINVPRQLHDKQIVHQHGVNHVTFSADGRMYATCGQDAKLMVWKYDESGEDEIIIDEDLGSRFSWTEAVKVQFNKSCNLVMVTGVLRQNIARTRLGEILVLECTGEDVGEVTSRISLKPHETVGCWYNNSYLVSSDYEWLATNISSNKLWINKVNYTMDSDPSLACMRQLYRLYNCAGSCVRNITVVPVPRQSVHNYRSGLTSSDSDTVLAAYLSLVERHCLHHVTIDSGDEVPAIPADMDSNRIRHIWDKEYVVDYFEDALVDQDDFDQELCPIKYSPQYYKDRKDDFFTGKDEDDWLWEDEELCEDDYEFQWEYFGDNKEDQTIEEDVVMDQTAGEEVLNEEDKLMIFSTGRRTCLSHQIGIKLMSKVKFKKKLHIPENISQVIQEQKQRREEETEELQARVDVEITPWGDYRAVAGMFDVADVIFDFSAFITGYHVSPDSRYLYVNTKPWPSNVIISPDPYIPPPASLTTQRVVVDLARMEVVGKSNPKHRIFVPGDLCEPSPVQVTRHYVCTVSGDQGLIFDRHSGTHLASLKQPGTTVTGCVVNPHDCHLAVTVGDDGSLLRWRSDKWKSKKVNEDTQTIVS